MKLVALILFTLGLVAPLTQGFTSHTATIHYHRELSPFATPKPSVVSVCTAELCCCQDEGPGGNEILAALQSQNLPYAVNEAPCLGACGGGAMVAIDFEDGSSALVTGILETLMELGLSGSPTTDSVLISAESISLESPPDDGKMEQLETMVLIAGFPSKTISETSSKPAKSSSTELVDVRDRMRAEVAKDKEERVNPWLNAATYLAGKAAQQLFGEK